jgi:hypothetical protein
VGFTGVAARPCPCLYLCPGHGPYGRAGSEQEAGEQPADSTAAQAADTAVVVGEPVYEPLGDPREVQAGPTEATATVVVAALAGEPAIPGFETCNQVWPVAF